MKMWRFIKQKVMSGISAHDLREEKNRLNQNISKKKRGWKK